MPAIRMLSMRYWPQQCTECGRWFKPTGPYQWACQLCYPDEYT